MVAKSVKIFIQLQSRNTISASVLTDFWQENAKNISKRLDLLLNVIVRRRFVIACELALISQHWDVSKNGDLASKRKGHQGRLEIVRWYWNGFARAIDRRKKRAKYKPVFVLEVQYS